MIPAAAPPPVMPASELPFELDVVVGPEDVVVGAMLGLLMGVVVGTGTDDILAADEDSTAISDWSNSVYLSQEKDISEVYLTKVNSRTRSIAVPRTEAETHSVRAKVLPTIWPTYVAHTEDHPWRIWRRRSAMWPHIGRVILLGSQPRQVESQCCLPRVTSFQ